MSVQSVLPVPETRPKARSSDDNRRRKMSHSPPQGEGRPSLEALVHPFPSGRARGRLPDYLRFHAHKAVERYRRDLRGEDRVPPHPRLLSAAAQEVLRVFSRPTCVETGCIRSASEGTESTLAIASVLRDEGRFFTFELAEEHIEACRRVCGPANAWIRYVQGDAATNLRRLAHDGTLREVHLAFLDSADDPDQIWREFRTLEPNFVPGSLCIVDDAIAPAVKGRRVKPHLVGHRDWDVRVVFTWKGLLVARKR